MTRRFTSSSRFLRKHASPQHARMHAADHPGTHAQDTRHQTTDGQQAKQHHRARGRSTLKRAFAGLCALALGGGLAAGAQATPVPVHRDLTLTPVPIEAKTAVLDFGDLHKPDITPLSGLTETKPDDPARQRGTWSLKQDASSATARISGAVRVAAKRYDVVLTLTPQNPDHTHTNILILESPIPGKQGCRLTMGNKTDAGWSDPSDEATDIAVRIVYPGTNRLAPIHEGVTAFVDLDGVSPGTVRGTDEKGDDEGIILGDGWQEAHIASDAHISVDEADGMSEHFTGARDEDNYDGKSVIRNAPAFSVEHNLRHMTGLRFAGPRLSVRYHSNVARGTSFVIDTNPRIYTLSHEATRTIVLHEPVGKTVTQHSSFRQRTDGSWPTGSWPAYVPEVPAGYSISSGPERVEEKTVTHQTGNETVNVYYQPRLTPVADSKTVTRTIVQHEPINKTIRQTVKLTYTGKRNESNGTVSGSWSKGEWDEAAPETSDGWTPSMTTVSHKSVTHMTKDEQVDIWYSTSARFLARTPSCAKEGEIGYSPWKDVGAPRKVRYGERLTAPRKTRTEPETWSEGAWQDKEKDGKAFSPEAGVTTANPVFYWVSTPPKAAYDVTTKAKGTGEALASAAFGGLACSITHPEATIPDGWHVVEGQDPLPGDVTIPLDGKAKDLVVVVEKDQMPSSSEEDPRDPQPAPEQPQPLPASPHLAHTGAVVPGHMATALLGIGLLALIGLVPLALLRRGGSHR